MRSLFLILALVCIPVAQEARAEDAPAERVEKPRPHGPGRGHRPPPFERVLQRHAERLGLDEATLAEIERLADAARSERQARRDELRELRRALFERLNDEAPDEAAVMAQVEEIGRLKTELEKERIRTMLAIRARLTPEQRRELVLIHEERRERFRSGEGARAPRTPR